MKRPSRTTPRPAADPPVADRRSGHSIGQLALEFQISARTIRFYEQKGLLTPERNGSQRIFDDGDRRRLVLILRTKNLGFSLQQIGHYLSLYDIVPGSQGARKSALSRLDSAIAELKAMRIDLDAALADLEVIREACNDQQPRRGR